MNRHSVKVVIIRAAALAGVLLLAGLSPTLDSPATSPPLRRHGSGVRQLLSLKPVISPLISPDKPAAASPETISLLPRHPRSAPAPA